jgi:aminoglycoside 6'-N-acetyltransferase
VIRAFRVDDVEALSMYAREYPAEQPGSWLGGGLPADAARYVADTIARYGRPPRADLAVTYDGQLIGGLGYRQVWVAPFQLDVGWVVHPAAAGHGLATEAVNALIDHLHESFPDLVRIEARVRESDTAGIRLLEGLGFCQEGLLRHAAGDGGNARLYGLLRGERMQHVGVS